MRKKILISTIALLALAFSSLPSASAYIGGGGGQYVSTTNCSGINQYTASDRFVSTFTTSGNSFSFQLNVGGSKGEWFQVVVQSISGINYVTLQESGTSILSNGGSYSYQYGHGSDFVSLTLTTSGNYIFGAVDAVSYSGQTLYYKTMSYNLGYHAILISAYSGLYGSGMYSSTTFSHTGYPMVNIALNSAATSGNVISWNMGVCNGHNANFMTGESSNLSYTGVSSTNQVLYYSLT